MYITMLHNNKIVNRLNTVYVKKNKKKRKRKRDTKKGVPLPCDIRAESR